MAYSPRVGTAPTLGHQPTEHKQQCVCNRCCKLFGLDCSQTSGVGARRWNKASRSTATAASASTTKARARLYFEVDLLDKHPSCGSPEEE